jgi:hypothetical protein
MKEKDIIDLGFEKNIVPIEESGMDYDFYYYSLDIAQIDLLSQANDEVEDGNWKVQILESGITISDKEDLIQLIQILKRNQE